MESRNALARLADVAEGAVPLLERLRSAARHAADELKIRLLGRDFEQRVSMLKARYVDLGGDPFGFDPGTARNAAITLAFFHRMYFRTEVFGIENVPPGRVLLVANHSGQVPIDAAIVGSSLFFDANPPRVMRAMVEKWTATLPFVSAFFNRVGQVVGVPENARRLLEMGEGCSPFRKAFVAFRSRSIVAISWNSSGSASCAWRSKPTRQSSPWR